MNEQPTSDIAATVQRLRSTYDTDVTRPLAWRRRQLEALGRLLSEEKDALTEAIDVDLRRGRFEAALFDLSATTSELEHALSSLTSWMRPTRAATPIATKPGRAWVHREPLGVVLVISPWNYPVHLALGPLIPALAAGNCVIIKPSELTPAVSATLARLLPRYLDPSAVAVVEGGPEETNDLIEQGLDHIFFTGSPRVGSIIMSAAAKHLTPVTLELGGKSPAVVTADADLDVAARRIGFGKITNSGQTCIAVDHVLVDASVKHELTARLATVLDTFSEGAAMPVLDENNLRRLEGLLESAGGEVVGGGIDHEAIAMHPTIVVDPDPGSDLMKEEIFGPILPIVGVDGLDDAIWRIRAGTKPLAAYLFSGSRQAEERFVEFVSAGGVTINHTMLHLNVPELPFGGVGTSGMGNYHGRFGFETFSHAKAVLRRWRRLDLPLIYPPYRGLKRRVMERTV